MEIIMDLVSGLKLICILISQLYVIDACYQDGNNYLLSQSSEEYNTHYLYSQNFPRQIPKDSTIYIESLLPTSFVIELGALKEGEKSLLIYDDNKELLISKNNGNYWVHEEKLRGTFVDDTKLSLYFLKDRVDFYVDEQLSGMVQLKYDHRRKIGVRWAKDGRYCYHYLNCYTPCKFKEIDYGALLDAGKYTRTKGKYTLQSVGEDYSLTFPKEIACNSQCSMRFEYRFEDSKKEGKTKTQKGRSEIAGVSSSSMMGKWVIEFDFYVPKETADDSKHYDIITQLHDHSKLALSPAFCIGMKGGELFCRLRGDSIPVEQWKKPNKPVSGTHITNLGYLTKDTWHHVKIFLKLAYQRSMNPLTVIWLDSEKVFESDLPNCYNYEPKTLGVYDYIKFGIYKSSWLGLVQKPEDTDRRIYYFDNYKVKY